MATISTEYEVHACLSTNFILNQSCNINKSEFNGKGSVTLQLSGNLKECVKLQQVFVSETFVIRQVRTNLSVQVFLKYTS